MSHHTTPLYIVFREGVYRHECGGVYSTEALAIEAAIALIKGENDDHHHYTIVPLTLDATPGMHAHIPGAWQTPQESEPIAEVHRHRKAVRMTRPRTTGQWIEDSPPWWTDGGCVIEVEATTGNIIGRVEIPPWQDQEAETPGIRLITDIWQRAEFPPGARWRYFDGPTSHHI